MNIFRITKKIKEEMFLLYSENKKILNKQTKNKTNIQNRHWKVLVMKTSDIERVD